jgi:hypothetical protein
MKIEKDHRARTANQKGQCRCLIAPQVIAPQDRPCETNRASAKTAAYHPELNAGFTVIREGGVVADVASALKATRAKVISTRNDIRATFRGAQARPDAALILGGLLLLTVP